MSILFRNIKATDQSKSKITVTNDLKRHVFFHLVSKQRQKKSYSLTARSIYTAPSKIKIANDDFVHVFRSLFGIAQNQNQDSKNPIVTTNLEKVELYVLSRTVEDLKVELEELLSSL